MDSEQSFVKTPAEVNRIEDKFDEHLHDVISWSGEVGKSLERSDDYIKSQMQYVDRLAVLSGAMLAFSVPAFTSLHNPSNTITHRYMFLGCVIAGWIFLFLAIVGSVVTHYLLVIFYARCTNDRETNVLGVLFHNTHLTNKRLMRLAGADADQLKGSSLPTLFFRVRAWHKWLVNLLTVARRFTIASCLIGIFCILAFLVLSTF